MAEISNNLLAVLLVVAILVSGFGLLSLMEIGRIRVTGVATGLANVTVSGAPAISMIRNVTDFGASDLGAATRTIDSQTDNFGNFSDGSEGNGTNYGKCATEETPENCSYPMVVNNSGNVNVDINITSDVDPNAAGFMDHAAGLAWFKGVPNESGACSDWAGWGQGSWVQLNDTPDDRSACTSLKFGDSEDELAIHFRLTLPGDLTPAGMDTVITIQATQVA